MLCAYRVALGKIFCGFPQFSPAGRDSAIASGTSLKVLLALRQPWVGGMYHILRIYSSNLRL
jgi:hypothetical protein